MLNSLNKGLLALSFMLFSLLATQAAFAESLQSFATALRGYDAVVYHTENRAVEGNTNFAVHHGNLTYLFASKANAETFQADPAKYEPAYNGYCAMGVALGKKLPTDPLAFKIVDGKLFMNLNAAVQKKWLEDVSGNIETADKTWTDIRAVHPSKL